MSVLFVDLVGSTARAERLDPEDVRAFLDPYYERVRLEIERFGGVVEKFIGDAPYYERAAPFWQSYLGLRRYWDKAAV